MSNSTQVTALRVDDEAFLVASTIERCPKTMMIRELLMNAVEAAGQAPENSRFIEISSEKIGNVSKLCIYNTGPGMSSEELHKICDLASSIGKNKGLDENFGMGAKVASLPSNRYGLRYRSCKNGVVSEVILCQRNGVYGRLKRQLDDTGAMEEVIDVTNVCQKENNRDLSRDWTEVVLLGNHPEQNTVENPYDENPRVIKQWLADYMYHRFYRLPSDMVVKLFPETHKLDGKRVFQTIPNRRRFFENSESVKTASGIIVHYYYDPPITGGGHNKSVSGSITTDVSICCVVFKNEMYDLKRGRRWTLDAPIFGVPFGAKHISIHIELPADYEVRPDAYRQFLRYRLNEQNQVSARDFADLAREHRPIWLTDIINSYAPSDSGANNEINQELQKLLNSLRVQSQSPRVNPEGNVEVEPGQAVGVRPVRNGTESGAGASPRLKHDDILVAPMGARRATISLNAERAPEIIPLYDEKDVDEKELKGKAAKFYSETSQLFINMHYPAVKDMQDLLEKEYAAAPDLESMRRMTLKIAERTIMIRVGRAVVYALAKRLNQQWTIEDMLRAQSPESLSLAADDFIDALQNARRRIGKALRINRQEAENSLSKDDSYLLETSS